jgi:hypothetical protein
MPASSLELSEVRGSHRNWLKAIGIFSIGGHFILSVLFYKERLMTDGAYMIFEMCNTGWFPQEQNRYIIWLLNFLPVLAVKLDLSIKSVIISWNLNYFLFYLTCFYFVVFRLKDEKAGWMIVGLRSFTTSTSFFNIANEILPGAVLSILLLSLIRKKPGSYMVISILLFFVAFSHLLVGVSLFLYLAYATITQGVAIEKTPKVYLGWFILFSLLFFIRCCMATLEPYESSRLTSFVSNWADIQHYLNHAYVKALLVFILSSFPAIFTLLLLLIVTVLADKNWLKYAGIALIIVVYMAAWITTVRPETPKLLNRFDHLTIRWFFPIAFCVVVLFVSEVYNATKYKSLIRTFPVVVFILLLVRFSTLYNNSYLATNTVQQYELLIDYALKMKVRKCYVPFSVTCPNTYTTDFYVASLVYSSIKSPDSCVHIIPAKSRDISALAKVGEQELYQSIDRTIPVSVLNPEYFRLPEEDYEYLPVGSIDCDQLATN